VVRNFCGSAIGKDFHDFFFGSLTIAKPCQFLCVCSTTPTPNVQLEGAVIMASKICVEAMVRGYHIYKVIWDANVGEELPCRRGLDNHQDSFAIAVLILLVKVGE